MGAGYKLGRVYKAYRTRPGVGGGQGGSSWEKTVENAIVLLLALLAL